MCFSIVIVDFSSNTTQKADTLTDVFIAIFKTINPFVPNAPFFSPWQYRWVVGHSWSIV